jgi:hypothetical protein
VVGQVSGVRVERPGQSESWDPVAVGTGKWQQNNPTDNRNAKFPERKHSTVGQREKERKGKETKIKLRDNVIVIV